MQTLGIESALDILISRRIHVEKAYPAYFGTYSEFSVVREYLDSIWNLYCIGRNGQHRYNNIDHSMITAFKAVESISKGESKKAPIWDNNAQYAT